MTEQLADTIVEDTVDESLDGTSEITSEQLSTNVDAALQKKIDVLRETFGDKADELVAAVTQKQQSWRETMNGLTGSHTLGDTEKDGAAGVTRMQARQVVLSKETARYKVDDSGYRGRVREHEEIHLNDQAEEFNQQEVSYLEKDGNVKTVEVKTIYEWQPSSQANIPSDLPPEYTKHVSEGNKMAKEIGGDGASLMEAALKSGDMENLQEEIIKKQQKQIMELLSKGKEVHSNN